MIKTTQLPQRLRKGIRNKIYTTYKTSDSWEFYKNKLNKNRPKEVNRSLFLKILKEFNNIIMDDIMHGDVFYMPCGLGDISVQRSLKSPFMRNNELILKHLPVDYAKTMEYWKSNNEAYQKGKVIYYENKHTDGYLYQFVWDKSTATSSRIGMYNFRPSRIKKRMLTPILKNAEHSEIYQDYKFKK